MLLRAASVADDDAAQLRRARLSETIHGVVLPFGAEPAEHDRERVQQRREKSRLHARGSHGENNRRCDWAVRESVSRTQTDAVGREVSSVGPEYFSERVVR